MRFVQVMALAALAVGLNSAALGHDAPAGAAATSAIALDAGLGRLHHAVSTRNAEAQAFFDQGMKLVFAFNHEAAIQSFQSDCPEKMTSTGSLAESLVWMRLGGPHQATTR